MSGRHLRPRLILTMLILLAVITVFVIVTSMVGFFDEPCEVPLDDVSFADRLGRYGKVGGTVYPRIYSELGERYSMEFIVDSESKEYELFSRGNSLLILDSFVPYDYVNGHLDNIYRNVLGFAPEEGIHIGSYIVNNSSYLFLDFIVRFEYLDDNVTVEGSELLMGLRGILLYRTIVYSTSTYL